MLKRLALIVLFGISNIQATETPEKTGFIQKVRNSPAIVKIVGAIIPCIAIFLGMNSVIKTYKDNPESGNIRQIAYYIKWISACIAATFCNSLMRVNFQKWLTCKTSNNINEGDIPKIAV